MLNVERREMRELMAEKFPNWNPVVAMAEIANNEAIDLDTRLQAMKEVAKYVEPQLKASEIKQTGIQQIIVKRESADSYPPIVSSTSGTRSNLEESQ